MKEIQRFMEVFGDLRLRGFELEFDLPIVLPLVAEEVFADYE